MIISIADRLTIAGLALLIHAGAVAAQHDNVPGALAAQVRPTEPLIAEILVQFKLDPALTRSMYMGERWISRETYTSTRQIGEKAAVAARAVGLDQQRKVVDKWLDAVWRSDDPDSLTIERTKDRTVILIVHRAGESRFHVSSGELSKTLTVRATRDERTMQVEISQAISESACSVDESDKKARASECPSS